MRGPLSQRAALLVVISPACGVLHRCTDDPYYHDIWVCTEWAGSNCSRGYPPITTPERIGLLLRSCPVSCSDETPSPTCSDVPIASPAPPVAPPPAKPFGGGTFCSLIPSACDGTFNRTTLLIQGYALSGTLPPELGNLSGLTGLSLTDNRVSGTLPPSWSRLHSMNTLLLGINRISGVFPPAWTSLQPALLTLNGNRLSGTLPSDLVSSTKLLKLSLATNSFSGTLPERWNYYLEGFISNSNQVRQLVSIPATLLVFIAGSRRGRRVETLLCSSVARFPPSSVASTISKSSRCKPATCRVQCLLTMQGTS